MAFLELENICKAYTRSEEVLQSVSFQLQEGSLAALLGESGSGKTTLLRVIAGFEYPDRGVVKLNGNILSDGQTFVKPENRKIVVVFQDFALFPHLTVEKNILFGMDKGVENTTDEVKKLLDLVGLSGLEKRYPHELSGGQQQRVALARALAAKPQLLLLDEPFSNLDQSVRENVRRELAALLKQTGVTTLMVTHDTADCLAMADEVLVLEKGRIVQQDQPHILYDNPSTTYVARLFGAINMFTDRAGIRPEYIHLGSGDKQGTITLVKPIGREFLIEIAYNGIVLTAYSPAALTVGDAISISWNEDKYIRF
jgi:iron(III) transport system ATP-binding protein